MANKVLGMHRLKNKVNRNAFDLSHRHMFPSHDISGLILMKRLRLGTMAKPVLLPLTLMRLLAFVRTYSTILYLFSPFGNILNSRLII